MIVVVDYKKGNIKSVERGLAAAGAEVVVTDSAAGIHEADGIVLPGVGAFADAMNTLEETGQADAMREAVAAGTPFLGICLGMHLMYEAGEEHAVDGTTPGLGLLPGVVGRMPARDAEGRIYKVPHVGWNTVEVVNGSEGAELFAGIPQESYFYFTHSFMAPESDCTCGRTAHSVTFPSACARGRAFGVQFHPEKSSDAGTALLANFVRLVSTGSVCADRV